MGQECLWCLFLPKHLLLHRLRTRAVFPAPKKIKMKEKGQEGECACFFVCGCWFIVVYGGFLFIGIPVALFDDRGFSLTAVRNSCY